MACASVESTLKESLQIIKRELTTGMRSGLDGEEMYDHTKSKGNEHSKLKFEGEDKANYDWHKTNDSNHFNARSKLQEHLPTCVCDQLTPSEISDITRIMNESAGVDGLTTILFNSKSDIRTLAEFSIMQHIHDDHSQIKIHYLKITATANCSRFLMFSNNDMVLRAEYKVSTFSVKNEDLLDNFSCDYQSALQRALDYLATNNLFNLKALRF